MRVGAVLALAGVFVVDSLSSGCARGCGNPFGCSGNESRYVHLELVPDALTIALSSSGSTLAIVETKAPHGSLTLESNSPSEALTVSPPSIGLLSSGGEQVFVVMVSGTAGLGESIITFMAADAGAQLYDIDDLAVTVVP